ncbi:uncharacterized protein RAG0_06437 [Rhynchosporium agropyri]|uniref:Carboxymuconolactone decarboxylase-like domain-containing protein n=2 Tax=Rhynchosporium TaxID=38037 RepID=A0A1E1M373_RHYSE|nr:uncharacterized protein RAG0_06437 [Rhynchosporium agropyri]CZT43536.1 uncharacterized protein RSE6_03592 [Rhynchosporium secalis]
MSPVRIPYRPASILPVGIPPLNLFRMWAHSPSTLPHAISLGTACFRDTSLSPYQRELVCLLNAHRLSCDYQWKQHIQIARTTGISNGQIEAIIAGNITSDVWSDQEKALLAFVDEVIAGPEVRDVVFDNARSCLSDQTLVEIVTMQGFYYSLARIATVFRVDFEHSSKAEAQRAYDVKNGEGSP